LLLRSEILKRYIIVIIGYIIESGQSRAAKDFGDMQDRHASDSIIY